MKSIAKRFNVIGIITVIAFVLFAGVFAAYRNSVLSTSRDSAMDESNREIQQWDTEHNIGNDENSTNPSNPNNPNGDTSSTPTVMPNFKNFDEIYNNWEGLLEQSESFKMSTTGNADVTGKLGPIGASINRPMAMEQQKDKAGNTYFVLKFNGGEILGYSANANNRYYWDNKAQRFRIGEWEFNYNYTEAEYMRKYGWKVGTTMLYKVKNNVTKVESFNKTATGYEAVTVLNNRAGQNLIRFLEKMVMVDLSVKYNTCKISWKFDAYGYLQEYTAEETYDLNMHFGPVSGTASVKSVLRTVVRGFNSNVTIIPSV